MIAKEFDRNKRIAQEMKKEIAIILQRDIKDPRIKIMMITVSDIKISRDLAYAKVYVTLLNDKEDIGRDHLLMKTLQKASGYIRTLLSQAMYLRIVPELTFIYDNSQMEAMRITQLVTSIVKHDKEYQVNQSDIRYKEEK